MNDEQMKTLLDAVKGTRAYVFCMIGLYAGLRREEILGSNGTVFLWIRLLVFMSSELAVLSNRPVVEERLKTKASKRRIPIPPPAGRMPD